MAGNIDLMIAELRNINNDCSCNESNCICKCINEEVEKYEVFIRQFFSCTGEASRIKEIYSCLREDPSKREKKVCCIDLNKSYVIYNEYHDGMISFIKEIFNKVSNIECGDITHLDEKLAKARECDKAFIESLFNGENNKEEESYICDALRNIEFLIDFIPQMHRFKDVCTELCGVKPRIDGCPSHDLIENSLCLLYSSVSEYCNKCIESVICTYSKICDAMDCCNSKENNIQYKLF